MSCTKLPRKLPPIPSAFLNSTLLPSSEYLTLPSIPVSDSIITMKLTTLQPSFFPKKKGKKKNKSSQSISRPDQPSFSSTDSASSSDQSISLHDQTISPQELEAILRRLDTKEEEMAAILAENPTGYNIAKMEPADETELREAFGVFDTDGDGRISAEELHEMLVMLGDEHCTLDECRSMIRMVDRVGAGFVCFDDFVCMMNGGWR